MAGTGAANAASDIEQFSGRGFVSIILFDRDFGVNKFIIGDKVILFDVHIGKRIDSDWSEGNLSEIWKIFRKHVCWFIAVKGDGKVSLNCILSSFSGVTVNAAWDIQRKYCCDRGVDH